MLPASPLPKEEVEITPPPRRVSRGVEMLILPPRLAALASAEMKLAFRLPFAKTPEIPSIVTDSLPLSVKLPPRPPVVFNGWLPTIDPLDRPIPPPSEIINRFVSILMSPACPFTPDALEAIKVAAGLPAGVRSTSTDSEALMLIFPDDPRARVMLIKAELSRTV